MIECHIMQTDLRVRIRVRLLQHVQTHRRTVARGLAHFIIVRLRDFWID